MNGSANRGKNIKRSPKEKWEWVKYNLRLAGYSLHALARELNVSVNAVHLPSKIRYPKMERIIAGKIGLKPEDIWPERYDENGKPSRISVQYHKREFFLNRSRKKTEINGK